MRACRAVECLAITFIVYNMLAMTESIIRCLNLNQKSDREHMFLVHVISFVAIHVRYTNDISNVSR